MRHFHVCTGPLLTTPCVMHHYEAFVSGCMFVHVASVWEELCRSRGLDKWLVLECQMAEEGIMVDSSCCHEVEVGCEGGSAKLFCEWALCVFWTPPPSISVLLGSFCGEGMGTQEPGSKRLTFLHLSLATSLLLPFLFLGPPLLYSSPTLALSLYLSLPGSACFVPCLIFHGIYFI